MHIGTAYLALAAKIQEAAMAMCHDDIRTRLCDALRDSIADTGAWGYVVAVFGDDKAGDVVYSVSSDLKKAPYTMTAGGATIDMAKAVDVVPLTTYETESVQIGEAGARNSKRDLMQLQTIHDSAVTMGANCSMKEAAHGNTTGLRLVESAGCAFLGDVPIREAARKSYPILMITPGTGSSAHYPAEVLKKAAESGAFKKGTFMFWNHPTNAEESQRPEGNLDHLAAITTSDGEYRENGAKGPGIYAEAKVMADYADKIADRAPHIGLSIRAGGTTSGKTVDGKPVLASIDHVESVDYVTKAGRGGMALAESDKFTRLLESFNEGEVSEMDAAEIKKLQESLAAQTAINERLLKRAMRADAMELAAAVLSTTSLTEAQRRFVAQSVIGTTETPRELPMKEGVLDAAKLTESVNAAAKAYSATLPATGGVRGMGAGPTLVTESAEVKAAREAAVKESQGRQVRALMELGLSEAAAKESVGVAA
jgi:hypothetical protein